MILLYRPNQEYTLWREMDMTPDAVMVFLVGQRITPFVSLWSTMTNRVLKPAERGRLVIRSQETCWKGQDAEDEIRERGGTVGCIFALACWQAPQPLM